MAADDAIKLTIDGREFSLDPNDLELGEVEQIEEMTGAPISELDLRFAKSMRALVYLVVHRDNPAFTLEDAAKIKVSAIGDPDAGQGKAKAKRPTKAAASGS